VHFLERSTGWWFMCWSGTRICKKKYWALVLDFAWSSAIHYEVIFKRGN